MKWQGKGVSEGLAMAQIYLFTPKLPEISRQPAADAEAEVAKLEATLAAAEEELRGLYETAKEKMGEQEAEMPPQRSRTSSTSWRRCSAPSATS